MTVVSLSEMTSLAIHSMIYIAGCNEEVSNIKDIIEAIDASEAHLSKVLQRLVKSGMLFSYRGPKGGFALAKQADKIYMGDVVEIFEGKSKNCEDCPMNKKKCTFSYCPLKKLFEASQAVYQNEFGQLTLADILKDMKIEKV